MKSGTVAKIVLAEKCILIREKYATPAKRLEKYEQAIAEYYEDRKFNTEEEPGYEGIGSTVKE